MHKSLFDGAQCFLGLLSVHEHVLTCFEHDLCCSYNAEGGGGTGTVQQLGGNKLQLTFDPQGKVACINAAVPRSGAQTAYSTRTTWYR